MAYLFWGFLFTFVNFYLRWQTKDGSYPIGIAPDFVGFLLLWKGLRDLQPESRVFKRLIPASVVFVFVSAAMYVFDFFSVFIDSRFVGAAIDIIYTAARLFFCYLVVRGIKDMEIKRNAEFYSGKLFSAWAAVFIFNIFARIPVKGIKVAGVLGVIVVTAMFLVRMWDSMKNYKECLEKNGPATE